MSHQYVPRSQKIAWLPDRTACSCAFSRLGGGRCRPSRLESAVELRLCKKRAGRLQDVIGPAQFLASVVRITETTIFLLLSNVKFCLVLMGLGFKQCLCVQFVGSSWGDHLSSHYGGWQPCPFWFWVPWTSRRATCSVRRDTGPCFCRECPCASSRHSSRCGDGRTQVRDQRSGGQMLAPVPKTRRSSATDQAKRLLMRAGRSGPVSLQAHRRRVCSERLRWKAASAVVMWERVSSSRRTGCATK